MINGIDEGVKAVIKFWILKSIGFVLAAIIAINVFIRLCKSPTKLKNN